MKSELEEKKKKKKKKDDEEKTQQKSNPPRPQWTLGRASLAAWVAQAPGHATQVTRPGPPDAARPKSRDPGRAASDLVSLSLIWLFLPLWSDPIRWGEATLETQSF